MFLETTQMDRAHGEPERGSGQFVTHGSEAEVEPGPHAAVLTPGPWYLSHTALLQVCFGACGVSELGCFGAGTGSE